MPYIEQKCKECGEVNEIMCDGDSPMYCPDCLMIDEFEDVEEKTCECCNKTVSDFYKETACSKRCYQELIAENKHFDKF